MADKWVTSGPPAEVLALNAVVKVAAWLPVSAEMLAEGAPVRLAVDEALDRWLNPWKYPDRPRWPAFTLVPWLARLSDWWARRRDRGPCVWVERI